MKVLRELRRIIKRELRKLWGTQEQGEILPPNNQPEGEIFPPGNQPEGEIILPGNEPHGGILPPR